MPMFCQKETLRDICAAVDIPVVAIGGISESNIMQLSGTGVDGVALVSAIFGAGRYRERVQNAQGPVRKHGFARMR